MKTIFTLMTMLGLIAPAQMHGENTPKWEITGQVIEYGSQSPLPYVTVSLYNRIDSSLITGTITDDDGNFFLSKIEEGTYFLTLSFIGFEERILTELPFNVDEREINLGLITLKPSSTVLDEVIIKSKATSVSSSVDKQVLNVSQNIVATGGTAVDALRASGSVQIDSDENVKLRGSSNFTVLINGTPSALDANEILKQTPANQIKNIEIITNPSVKYNAEGGAGIINIILKKGASSGINGMLNGTVGTRNKYGSDASFNRNKEELSLSAAFSYRDFTKASTQEYDKSLLLPDTSHYGFMDQKRSFRNYNLDFRFGANYEPNKKTNVSYAFHTGNTKNELDIDVKTFGHTIPASIEKHMINTFDLQQNPVFYTNNLGIMHRFDGGKRTINLNTYYSYIEYFLTTKQKMQEADLHFEALNSTPYLQDIINTNNSHDLRLDLDYSQPINNQFNLEAGASLHTYIRGINVKFSAFNYANDSWEDNPLYTNKFDFNENIYGAYANVNGNYKGFQISMGLRAEYMGRILDQLNSESAYPYNKLNWFPGFSFSRSFRDKNIWSLAMSNRINRPDEYYLNPYPEFEDDYFYSEGNPNVIPEIVRNLEFSYKNINERAVLSANIFFRTTENKISQLLVEGSNNKLRMTFHNDATDRSLGIETMGNFTLAKWWSANAAVSGYQLNVSGNVAGEEIKRSNFVWTAQLANSFQLRENTSLQTINYFSSATQEVQYEVSGYYFMDIALKHAFMDGKLNISVQAKDILRSMNYSLITEAQHTHLIGEFGNESPIILLNIGYQISQYKKNTKDVQTEFDM